MSPRIPLRLVSLVLAGFFLAGEAWAQAGAHWKAIEAKANGQSLAVVVHQNPVFAATMEAFRKAHPKINVQVTTSTPDSFAPRVINEQRNGIYAWDVWFSTTSNMNAVALRAGVLDPITPFLVRPEITDSKHWRIGKMFYSSDRGPYILIFGLVRQPTIFVNTDVLGSVAIKTPDDLLNPRLKGRMAIRDPSRGNAGSITLAVHLKSMGREKGEIFARRILEESRPVVMSNPQQISAAVMRGSFAAALGAEPGIIAKCKLAGGCRNVVAAPFGDMMLALGLGVMKNAPHPDSITVFVNWILSKEGQETFSRIWRETQSESALSARKDVASLLRPGEKAPDYHDLSHEFVVGTDEADSDISRITKIAQDIRDKSGRR